jgi:hypothetical protein
MTTARALISAYHHLLPGMQSTDPEIERSVAQRERRLQLETHRRGPARTGREYGK